MLVAKCTSVTFPDAGSCISLKVILPDQIIYTGRKTSYLESLPTSHSAVQQACAIASPFPIAIYTGTSIVRQTVSFHSTRIPFAHLLSMS